MENLANQDYAWGALEYESDVQVPTKNKVGDIRCKISSKKVVIRCGHQKRGLFWCGLPKRCAKMQFQAKFANFMLKLP